MSIDIAGLDRAAVLAALYNHSRQQGLGVANPNGTAPMTVEQAAQALAARAEDPSFDYLNGRVLKVDLSGDQLDPWLYDRDNGDGACAAALAPLRRTTAA